MTQQTSIFANCPDRSDWEVIFELCPNATDPCKSIKQIETAVHIAFADYYTSEVLFAIAGIMNIYCLLVLLPLYRRMKDNSKKKYIFLITRCVAGLLAASAWLLIQCIYLRFIAPTPGNFPYYVLALALNIGSTYGLLGSYVGMAGILYLGVLNPISFTQHLSLRVVYIAVSLIVSVSIALSIPLAIFQAAISIPVSGIKCSKETCAPLIATLNFILVFGSIVFAFITLSFVLISLIRHQKQFNKLDTTSNTSLTSAIRLLSWTLFTVLLVLFAEVIPFVFMEEKKIRGTKPPCYWFDHSDVIISQVSWALVEASLWSIAMIVDPFTNIILDRNVSKQAKKQKKGNCFVFFVLETQNNMNQSIFENCSSHYSNEILFENCTETSAPCLLIQDLNTAISVIFYAYYVSISMFSIAALANFYCLCVTLPLYFEMEAESKKRYIFLVTRCLSCIFMVIAMILSTAVFEELLKPNPANFFLYAVLNIVSNTSMFGLLGSYAGLAFLLYIGVMYPMLFKSLITLRFVYIMVFLIYFASFLISIPTGIFQAAIQSPGIISCNQKSCVPFVNLVEFGHPLIVSLIYETSPSSTGMGNYRSNFHFGCSNYSLCIPIGCGSS
ncbi:Protein CBG09098 [Caenorhabditis briggsae]|uniref:Protein CBG09098 n=1 Tax=Caenorhabditis briggsae TaxID=6238 RepID=A8X7T2_CAEBR|nr:Protein CBG09098 [Caenorhabditis briggsae]CAP28693.2 Protein CBG09098 [Caenorhabditis briggsae]